MKRVFRRSCVVVVLAAWSGAVLAQAPTAPSTVRPAAGETRASDDDARSLAPELVPVPTTDEEIGKRLVWVRAELAGLGPTSRSSTAPASGPAEVVGALRWNLSEVMGQYEAELESWQKVRAEIVRLKSPEATARLSADLKQWEERSEKYGSMKANVAQFAWTARSLLEAADQEHEKASSELQQAEMIETARDEQFTAIPRAKAAAEEAVANTLSDLKKLLAALPERLAGASRPEDRQVLLGEKRLLEWRHSLALLRLATMADRSTQLEIARHEEADRLAALRGYFGALQGYRTELQKIVTKDDLALAREQLARTDLPAHQRIDWQLRAMLSEAAADFQEYQKFADDIRSRTPDFDPDRLAQQIQRGRWYLDRFMESLDRRTGKVILDVYRTVMERLAANRARVQEIRSTLDLIGDRLRAAQDRRDEVMGRITIERIRMEDALKPLKGDVLAQARKEQARLTADVNALMTEKIDRVLADLTALHDRYDKVLPIIVRHVEVVELASGTLYRRSLLVADRGLLNEDWGKAWAEVRSAGSGQGEVGEQLRSRLAQVRMHLRALTWRQWFGAVALAVVSLCLGAGARRRLRSWLHAQDDLLREAGGPAAREGGEEGAVLDAPHRLQIQSARAVADTAPVLWPLLVLLACLIWPREQGSSFPVLLVVFGLAAVAMAGWAIIDAAFDARRAALRIVQCSDEVAAYHRRYLRLLGILSLALVPWPLLLDALGVMPEVSVVLWDASLAAILVVLFAYHLRGRMFLGLSAAEGERPGLVTRLIARVFPLLWAGVALLIVLQVIGYAALVVYLVRGLAITGAVILAARVVRGLLAAWSVPVRLKLAPVVEHPLWRLAAQLLRMAVFVVGAVVVLRVWGVSTVELRRLLAFELVRVGQGAITPARIVAAALAVAGGVIVSRTIRAFLAAEVFPQTRHMDRGTQAAVSTLLHYSIIALAAYLGLRFLLLDLGALAILLGTLGLGLGLGLQPLFVNFISGLFILFERQIKVGDVIEIDGTPCEVLTVAMRSTRVRTPDSIEYVIPNGDFITGRVVNWTLTDQRLRARMRIGVAYGSDVQLVRKLLLDVAHRHPDVLVDPPPEVWFVDFADNALVFVLVCWFADTAARWRFLSQVRFEIMDLFSRHGIEIPFPQRTISLLGDKPLAVEIRSPQATPPRPAPRQGSS